MARPWKVLPAGWEWEKEAVAVKVKSDKALTKLLEEYFNARRQDEYDKRLALLPKIQKLATDFKKSKEVVAGGPNAVKLVTELIDMIPKERKAIEVTKKEFDSNGAQKIDAQFMVVDWNGKPFEGTTCWAIFQSPGVPNVAQGGKLIGTGLDLNDLKLRPTGTVSLTVTSPSYTPIKGVTEYEFKPGKPVIKFKAVQVNKVIKVQAKNVKEATTKVGVKGSLGVEFSILKIGGEVSRETEHKKVFEKAVEWEFEYGLASFKDFKQL